MDARTSISVRPSFPCCLSRASLRWLLCAFWSASQAAAGWPFGGADEADLGGSGDDERATGIPLGAQFAFSGVPVIVVEGHMGANPWEELHRNVERAFQGAGRPAIGNGDRSQGGAMVRHGSVEPLESQLGQLMRLFGGDHAGHIGFAGNGFQVDNEETRLRISAILPGYNLGAESGDVSKSPLAVRAVGKTSLVVKGTQANGNIVTTFQRSFKLPKGSDIANISVTYSSSTGNLTVIVPHRSTEVAEADDTDDETEDDDFIPAPLRALQKGIPGLLGQLSDAQAKQAQASQGFLVPSRSPFEDMFADIFGQVNQMHPRYHPPPGGEQPVPEDVVVNLVGCFAESQLAHQELKYYSDGNAASFNAMYWHAVHDNVPYFAMSRHSSDMGHAFTARGFAHEHETPQWGVYDGCGSPCSDSERRYCGCANEASRGFDNPYCEEGQKRFAVYKIGAAAAPVEDEPASEGDATATASEVTTHAPAAAADSSDASAAAGGKWELVGDDGISVVVPKGTRAVAKGRQVLLFSDDSTTDENPQARTVGKVRLPATILPDSCELDKETRASGDKVLRCKLDKGEVKNIPIRVLDEL
eukprot:TRINITY_DN3435_c0_g3_i4.p1 TRINITY_DN3435_c0_g3~~TRINITY_DN3435_c0_g3_i4.p1  ORF type:complete len:604 (+),score=111.44 TRINITY_DN3435_c0_g3_i4:52-1812(+)